MRRKRASCDRDENGALREAQPGASVSVALLRVGKVLVPAVMRCTHTQRDEANGGSAASIEVDRLAIVIADMTGQKALRRSE